MHEHKQETDIWKIIVYKISTNDALHHYSQMTHLNNFN